MVPTQTNPNGAADEEMTDDDGNTSDKDTAVAAAGAAPANSSSWDGTGNDDEASVRHQSRVPARAVQ